VVAELKFLHVTIHEVALYRDLASKSQQASRQLWDLLTSSRDYLNYAWSIPRDVMKYLPAAFFNSTAYAMIVLATVSRAPSTAGWDSSIAKREADFPSIGERARTVFRDELSKTPGENVSVAEKDTWAFFGRGMGGLLAWHQRCEQQCDGGADFDLPISPSGTLVGSSAMSCTVADMMTPFTALRVRKAPTRPPSNRGGVEARAGPQPTPDAENGYGAGDGRPEPQSAGLNTTAELWDDEVWQSIMEDFSMFPTTAVFPAGSVGQYQGDRIRW